MAIVADMEKASLSVVMCNRSDGAWLRRSLPVLAAELTPDDEIVFVDDASEDDSLAVVDALLRPPCRRVVLSNQVSRGVIEAGRLGLAHATGRFVGWFSADDEVRPGLFAAARAAARTSPDVGVIASHTAVEQVGSGRAPALYEFADCPTGRALAPVELERILRRRYVWFASSGAFVRRDALVAMGGWRAELGPYADWFAVYSLAARYGSHLLALEGSLLRVRGDSYGARARKDEAAERAASTALFDAIEAPENADVRRFLKRGALALPYALGPQMIASRALWRRDPGLMAAIAPAYLLHRLISRLRVALGGPMPFGARAR